MALSRLMKLIENTFVDLARIPFIRDNQVFQDFLEIERIQTDIPFLRSLTSTVGLPSQKMSLQLSIGSNFNMPAIGSGNIGGRK